MLRKRNKWKMILVLAFMATTLVIYFDAIQDGIAIHLKIKLVGLNDQQILESMGSRRAADVIQPFTTTTYIQPKAVMLQNGSAPFMVILVTSVPNGEKGRDLIRGTWYKWKDEYNIKVFFFLGQEYRNTSASAHAIQALQEENRIHKDLIVDDFQEGYYRLTPKVLRMLKWFLSTYNKSSLPKYLVKTDQDVFINIPNLVSVVNSSQGAEPNSSSYYLGGVFYEGEPRLETNPNSKWYLTPEFWNLNSSILPNYVGGPCYILSGNVVEPIFNASLVVPMFPFEDTYLTGMVGKEYLNLNLSHIPAIVTNVGIVKEIIKSPDQTIQAVALHLSSPFDMMKNIYTTVINASNSCSSCK